MRLRQLPVPWVTLLRVKAAPFMKINRVSFARKRESIRGSSFKHAVKKENNAI